MNPKHDMPPIELLRELLSYCPETGQLTWIGPVTRNNVRKPGAPQGTPHHTGYLYVRLGERYFGKRSISAHRIAWALYYGAWPELFVDHINGNKTDNRICNLRAATRLQNKYNSKVRSDSTCGLKGVTFNYTHQHKPWGAQIVAKGKRQPLGWYATPEEAHEAYKAAAARLHGEFARTQ